MARRIALVAHDNKKDDLVAWARHNLDVLRTHELYATGTTGQLLHDVLEVTVTRFVSGPLGGDMQLGAAIAEGRIDILIFFWDPLEAQPHDPDIRALLRVAVVWNIPTASNAATADYLITSPLLTGDYEARRPDYGTHMNRFQTP